MSLMTYRILALATGILLLLGGIFHGDVLELWRRATQLCLGCIGIG